MRIVVLLALVGCFTQKELETALDRDGDGFQPIVAGGPDCDETRADVNPDAMEVCGDGIDNDCDGFIDDRGAGNALFYEDRDDDGFGTDATTEACSRPPGYATVRGDCDDSDPSRNPAVEDLCDGIDQNCDGVVDDASTFRPLYVDDDGDGVGTGSPVSICGASPGYSELGGDCNDADPAVRPGLPDGCDSVDTDCDGLIDDDAVFTVQYEDHDLDGVGALQGGTWACSALQGFTVIAGDCDDDDPTRRPGVPDDCDGVDTDCDGLVDEDATFTTLYLDHDQDGAGALDGTVSACSALAGYTTIPGDCDDADPGVRPGATDLCDGIDQDCDGSIDDDAMFVLYFPDLDGDGFGGSSADFVRTCDGAPPHHVLIAGDCVDDDPTIQVPAWFHDGDGDGYGAGPATFACDAPVHHVSADTDCDDGSAAISPGVEEICKNGVDDDCTDATRCRHVGPTADDAVSWFQDPVVFSVGSSHRRLGNVIGDDADDLLAYNGIVAGGIDFAPTSLSVPGSFRPGVDLDGDGYRELIEDTGTSVSVLQGGALTPLVEVTLPPSVDLVTTSILLRTPLNSGLFLLVRELGQSVEQAYFIPMSAGPTAHLADHPILGSFPEGTQVEYSESGSALVFASIDVRAVQADVFIASGSVNYGFDDLMVVRGVETGGSAGVLISTQTVEHFLILLDSQTGALSMLSWPDWPSFQSQSPGTMVYSGQLAVDGIPTPLGDLDGDGRMDFYLRPYRGDLLLDRVTILYGPDDHTPEASFSLSFPDTTFYSVFLESVSGLHDLDGDGYDDLVVVGFDSEGLSRAPVRVLYGSGL